MQHMLLSRLCVTQRRPSTEQDSAAYLLFFKIGCTVMLVVVKMP